MIYGADRIVQMPVMQLYDTGLMQQAVQNARYMYDKAEKRMDDFYEKYGEFMSPFQKDMDRYQQIVGAVRDGIDQLYASGEDPLRTATGRAKMAQLIRSVDPAEMSRMKANAKMGYEYLSGIEKARAKGEYDEDFENYLLTHGGPGLFNDFSSADGAMWNRPMPGVYKDLNSWTHHLFDDMELSYDDALTKKYPGYLAYTKSRDTMNTIVDNNIAEMLKTDLGQYQLDSIMNSIPGDNPNKRQMAIQELKRRIVDANWEEGRVKLESDPYAVARYNHRLSSGSGRGGGGGNSSQKLSYNYLTGVFTRGISNSFGYDPITQGEQAANNLLKNQVRFGNEIAKHYPYTKGGSRNRDLQYVNRFTTWEAPEMFSFALTRQPVNKTGGVYMTPDDIKRLHTTQDVVSNTYGYTNKRVTTDKSKIPTPIVVRGTDDDDIWTSNIIMQPYRDVYTSYQKHGSIDSQWKVQLYDSETGKVVGDYWYDLPMQTERNEDVPRLNEWRRDTKTGEYFLPKTSKGKRRDLPKLGVSKKASGYYEVSSLNTNKHLGVTKHDLDRNTSFAEESISAEPQWK